MLEKWAGFLLNMHWTTSLYNLFGSLYNLLRMNLFKSHTIWINKITFGII